MILTAGPTPTRTRTRPGLTSIQSTRTSRRRLRPRRPRRPRAKKEGENKDEGEEGAGASSRRRLAPTADTSLTTKLAWYASEAFGDITAALAGGKGKGKEKGEEVTRDGGVDISWEDAVERLRADYERAYFVTGDMDMDLYELDCEFADPFVSFRGLARFKKNLDNLGSFMQDTQLNITKFTEDRWGVTFEILPLRHCFLSLIPNSPPPHTHTLFPENRSGGKVDTKWSFKCTLNLPWKPNLAASGGTTHIFNTSNRQIQHIESWNIDPVVALRQLVRPGGSRQAK